jgi:hypothetical protein
MAVGFVSCDAALLTPREAEVDVLGTADTIICSPLVMGIVETWVSATVLEGIGLGGYPSFTGER